MASSSREEDIYTDIISGMICAIKNGDPVEEIRDMIIDNNEFKSAVKKWKDPLSQLNVLQTAVVAGDAGVVALLLESDLQFEYETVRGKRKMVPTNAFEMYKLRAFYINQRNRKNITREAIDSDTSNYPTFRSHGISDDSSFYEEFFQTSSNVKINAPLHLACKFGYLDIIKLFLPPEDDNFGEKVLQLLESSILNLTNADISDGKLRHDEMDVDDAKGMNNEGVADENNFDKGKVCGKRNEVNGRFVASSSSKNVTTGDETCQRNHCNRPVDAHLDVFKHSTPTKVDNRTDGNVKGKTPLEICVEEGHLECALCIAQHIFTTKVLPDFKSNRQFCWKPRFAYSSGRRDKNSLAIPPEMKESGSNSSTCSSRNSYVSPIQIACVVKSPNLLKLLLERKSYSGLVNTVDSQGLPPLYTALHKSTECVELLLKHGAKANVIVNHQSPLHWLYEDMSDREISIANDTSLLIQYGVNVNERDLNYNTPLDYLASDFGKILDKYYASDSKISFEGNAKENVLKKCMRLLLENGAETMVMSGENRVDHTVGHTLLMNCSWPVTAFMVKHPECVYSLLELMFQFGLDPNIMPTNNESNLFSYLICYCLKPLQIDMQRKFLHLFIINGAALNQHVPPPHHAVDLGPIRIWNVYPLIMTIQERLLVEVIAVICDYMSVDAFNECVLTMTEGNLWSRIQMLRSNGPPGNPAMSAIVSKYKLLWDKLVKDRQNARTLRHTCKLKILDCVKRKGKMVEYLTLPKPLKEYILSMDC